MTKKTADIARIKTGVRNLDELIFGGVPTGSGVVVAGPPGAGKTILTQQICFSSVSAGHSVLYFNTLSEPTAKTLRYLSQFAFFDAGKLDGGGMHYVDLGLILRTKELDEVSKLIMDQVKKIKPAIVVIDSFKVFDDLASSPAELRKFGYELAVNLMAWEATTFLLGEYGSVDIGGNPLFSIMDGLITVTQRLESGEHQRFIQIIKMRGTAHSRDEHPFVITDKGAEVFAPRVIIKREGRDTEHSRCRTGIAKLDDLLGEGIPRGSSLLIAGVAGTGKTVLLLEFVYRGAQIGEKGIVVSFEETEERLRATARGLGWDLDGEIERGMVEIVFIPQPDIMVERHLLMIRERIDTMQARRVAIDSVSVLLHKVEDPQIDREKIFQLASIIQNAQAVGFFATDIPYGQNQISRYGVEETVVDGVLLVSSTEEGLERERYIEVYKLRNTAHLKGRHNMVIGHGGITVFPRYRIEPELHEPTPPPPKTPVRLETGIPGLDRLCGGGFLERSITLVSGSAGIGKTTFGLQFIAQGAKHKQPGLYVALEEGPAQILETADGLSLPFQEGIDQGLVELVYLSRQHERSSQFIAILDDRIQKQKTRRLVLDSVGHVSKDGVEAKEMRQLLYELAVRFKAHGVTSVFTLESGSMHSTDTVTERGYSPIADNLLVLRYAQEPGELRPTVSVVKTRGGAHDRGTYFFTIAQGGIQIEERVDGGGVPTGPGPVRKRSRK